MVDDGAHPLFNLLSSLFPTCNKARRSCELTLPVGLGFSLFSTQLTVHGHVPTFQGSSKSHVGDILILMLAPPLAQ